jgi:hypothetical protein
LLTNTGTQTSNAFNCSSYFRLQLWLENWITFIYTSGVAFKPWY